MSPRRRRWIRALSLIADPVQGQIPIRDSIPVLDLIPVLDPISALDPIPALDAIPALDPIPVMILGPVRADRAVSVISKCCERKNYQISSYG